MFASKGTKHYVETRRPKKIKEANLTKLDADIKKVHAEAKRLAKIFPSYQHYIDTIDENPTRTNKAIYSSRLINATEVHLGELKYQRQSARGRLGHLRKGKVGYVKDSKGKVVRDGEGKPIREELSEKELANRIKNLEEEIKLQTQKIDYMEKEKSTLDNFASDVRYRTHKRNELTNKWSDTLETRLLELNDAKLAIVRRRERRLMELIEDKQKYDPELVAKRQEAFQKEIDRDYGNVYARLVKQGLLDEGGDIAGAAFNIGKIARKQAEVTSSKFLKDVSRIPLVSTLLERGPELDRTLNIDPLRVWSNGYRYIDFMERDLDHLARIYTRTVGADFEIYRSFGSVNPLGKGSEFIEQVNKQVEDMRAKVKEELEGKEAEKALARINNEYTRGVKELREVIERARDMRGIPEDPERYTLEGR